jgi:dihydroorotate dehydrogenase (NAD+) catalytic subunit
MVTGGLSGPAIRPLAVAKVYEAARAVRIPVVGIGGIAEAADVIEFLLAGASAVEVGTANYVEPGGAGRLAAGLADYLARHGFRSPRDLKGALHVPEPPRAGGSYFRLYFPSMNGAHCLPSWEFSIRKV